jgi:glycosyltransferase involved in cell wall biosynthesis
LVKDAASFDPTVQFLGMLPAETLMEEVKAAAVAIVPSLFPETMGLSALEALNAGTPIVSSGRGALADLNGPGVWTLPKVESPDLRAALVSLLIEGRSEQFQRELSTRDLSRYSLDKMIDAIEAEYLRTSHEYWSSVRGAE